MTSDNMANAGPLGLFGFGLTTVLLSVHNLGFFGPDKTMLATALFLGGIAQVIAGSVEFKRNKMFTATVFSFFGLFWITYAAINAPIGVLGTVDHPSTPTLFLLLLIMTIVLFIGTLKGPKALQFTFVVLAMTLTSLTIGAYMELDIAMKIGGVLGLITGAAAFYLGAAEVINEQHQKTIVPLF